MRSITLLAAISLAAAIPFAALADDVPQIGHPGTGFLTGDSPPENVYTFTGNGGIVHDVDPELMDTEGTFTIEDIPAGATVERALFVTGIWDSVDAATHSMHFVFDGHDYGTEPADVFDLSGGGDEVVDLGGYLVDVTADVPGNGTYEFSAVPDQEGTGSFGYLLAVVYSDPDAPIRRIDVNFGAESLRNDASTTGFTDIEPGDATLYIFTEGDQPEFSEGEESIAFNGEILLGGEGADIFDANQGPACSYFELPVTAVAGVNTNTITTGEDWLGWHYSALVSQPGATPTEQTTWGSIKSRFHD